MDEYIDYSELSVVAQIVFCTIEHKLFSLGVTEAHISKKELAWECGISLPNIKIGLRELKQKGYIIPKNNNSSILKVGEQYACKN